MHEAVATMRIDGNVYATHQNQARQAESEMSVIVKTPLPLDHGQIESELLALEAATNAAEGSRPLLANNIVEIKPAPWIARAYPDHQGLVINLTSPTVRDAVVKAIQRSPQRNTAALWVQPGLTKLQRPRDRRA